MDRSLWGGMARGGMFEPDSMNECTYLPRWWCGPRAKHLFAVKWILVVVKTRESLMSMKME